MLRRLFYSFSWLSGHKTAVLMYHRIANVETDPWQLSVSAENFEQQLQVLKNKFEILGLDEFIGQVANKKIRSNSVLLTFDDAYADNYLCAMPLLEKYQCPATFFVPTDFIIHQSQFWWDELENYILRSNQLPKKLSLVINKEPFEFTIHENELTEKLRYKQAQWTWPNEPPTERCALYLKLWECLRPLPYSEIKSLLEEIRLWSGAGQMLDPGKLPMTSDQLNQLAMHPLFDLGIHTKTHPALAYHSREIQQDEIVQCKNYLEQSFGKRIKTIAYPYGVYNDMTLTIAKEQQLAIGFTTESQVVTKKSIPLCLGRFQVLNWNGRDFGKQLRGLWVMIACRYHPPSDGMAAPLIFHPALFQVPLSAFLLQCQYLWRT
jgi:peptidoglycan/xylan/chitin deacetylase (PgdA/CDA1 family)